MLAWCKQIRFFVVVHLSLVSFSASVLSLYLYFIFVLSATIYLAEQTGALLMTLVFFYFDSIVLFFGFSFIVVSAISGFGSSLILYIRSIFIFSFYSLAYPAFRLGCFAFAGAVTCMTL